MTVLVDVKLMQNYYRIHGNLLNGYSGRDENGKPIPYIHPHDITRRVSFINYDEGIMYCECGRQFIIDDDLKLVEQDY